MTTKASDYLFAIHVDPECGPTIVEFVSKAFYDAHKGVESVHLSEELEPFWPEGIEMDEAAEASFFVNEELTFDEVMNEFVNAGFVHNEELQLSIGMPFPY